MSHQLPHGWSWESLSDMAELKGGLAKGKKRREGEPTRPVPYLRVANVQRCHLELSDVSLIDASESEIRALQLQKGDVLFNEGGDRDKLGRGWVWEGQLPECIHQNHVFRARLNPDRSDPYYLSYWGNSVGAQKYFIKEGTQTTNLASLSLSKLGSLPVPLPPVEVQHTVVTRIRALLAHSDRAKNALADVRKFLDQYRQSVLTAAFRGELTTDWRQQHSKGLEPASAILDRIRVEQRARWQGSGTYLEPAPMPTDDLPDLPEGWLWVPLEALVSYGPVNGYSPISSPDATGPLTLKLSATTSGQMILDDTTTKRIFEAVPNSSKFWLEPGDLLIQRANTVEYVGRAAIFDGPPNTYIYPDLMMKLRVSSEVETSYVWRYGIKLLDIRSLKTPLELWEVVCETIPPHYRDA